MSLKADMNADISEVFLNLEDFGERHVVDGKSERFAHMILYPLYPLRGQIQSV